MGAKGVVVRDVTYFWRGGGQGNGGTERRKGEETRSVPKARRGGGGSLGSILRLSSTKGEKNTTPRERKQSDGAEAATTFPAAYHAKGSRWGEGGRQSPSMDPNRHWGANHNSTRQPGLCTNGSLSGIEHRELGRRISEMRREDRERRCGSSGGSVTRPSTVIVGRSRGDGRGRQVAVAVVGSVPAIDAANARDGEDAGLARGLVTVRDDPSESGEWRERAEWGYFSEDGEIDVERDGVVVVERVSTSVRAAEREVTMPRKVEERDWHFETKYWSERGAHEEDSAGEKEKCARRDKTMGPSFNAAVRGRTASGPSLGDQQLGANCEDQPRMMWAVVRRVPGRLMRRMRKELRSRLRCVGSRSREGAGPKKTDTKTAEEIRPTAPQSMLIAVDKGDDEGNDEDHSEEEDSATEGFGHGGRPTALLRCGVSSNDGKGKTGAVIIRRETVALEPNIAEVHQRVEVAGGGSRGRPALFECMRIRGHCKGNDEEKAQMEGGQV
ncbi:hypothetical protein BDK51DRAFT_35225 [Blyttiomyces helicus]|uniref:Uncharacterized protein n=1 Tax=Blyttiomyces helicus TaxID=388810 RepID=A0A4P9WNP4_9FUNG|nr:hypothetical protein BDK51DRAFT_35225 [Blyttiomyces helicus]|eukprot:RKO94604.1 hypothetical protein BDK51DRAFT_35225 [Blyttiomyces helicus]